MSDARGFLDRITGAMNQHDLGAVANGYSTDAILTAPDGSYQGRDQVATYFGDFLTAFPDLHVTVWSKITSGEMVADEWSFSGTNTGPLALPDGRTLPPTGRSVSLRGCDIATVHDDEVISHRVYYDQAELMTQLGLDDSVFAGSAT